MILHRIAAAAAARFGGVPRTFPSVPSSVGKSSFSSSSSRRVIATELNFSREKDHDTSYATASILAQLKHDRIDFVNLTSAVNSPNFSEDQTVADIMYHSQGPRGSSDVDVAIGAYVWNEREVQGILRRLKMTGFNGRIILGGPQVSYSGKGLERLYPDVDIFIRGYAEQALSSLLRSNELFPETIDGVHFARSRDRLTKAEASLEATPSPYLTGILEPQSFVRWETQRGCPFRCTFCQHREPAQRHKPQHFNETRVAREVQWFSKNGVNDIAVLDPTFNVGPRYLRTLGAFVENKFEGKIALQSRFELCKDDFINTVASLNTNTRRVVLEFGLQTVHENEMRAINRKNNLSKVREVCEKLLTKQIPFEVSVIYGLPNQTLESFEQTIDFLLALQVPVIKAWPLMLLRGTGLDTKRGAFGLVEEHDVDPTSQDPIGRVQGGGISHVVESSTFTRSDWLRMKEIAWALSDTEGKHPAAVLQLL